MTTAAQSLGDGVVEALGAARLTRKEAHAATSSPSASTAGRVLEASRRAGRRGRPAARRPRGPRRGAAAASSSTKRREPEAVEQAPDLDSSASVEVASDVESDPLPLGGGAGVGEERRLLARAQVAGRALAGPGGVAEDAEEVVERAGRRCPGPVRPLRAGRPSPSSTPASTRSGLQREGEGVGAGLLLLHGQALGEGRGAGAQRESYVGELAGRRRVQGGVEEVQEPVGGRGRGAAGGDGADRGGEREVAGQDAGGAARRRRPRRGRPRPPMAWARKVPLTLGRPRRRSSPSITSSWMTNAVWSSSTAAPTVGRRVGRRPPSASWAATTSAGRNRLPPSVAAVSASQRRAWSGSVASARAAAAVEEPRRASSVAECGSLILQHGCKVLSTNLCNTSKKI